MSNCTCSSNNPTTDTLSEEDKATLLNAKIALIFAIGIVTFLMSLLPWVIKRKIKNAVQVLTIGMCFAGGIILGGAFSHLFPDAIAAWDDYFAQSSSDYANKDYPFASLLAAFTLLLLMAVDNVFLHRGLDGHGHSGKHGHNHMVIELPPLPSSPSSDNLTAVAAVAPADEVGETELSQQQRKVQAWIFFVALSLHSIFDGLGIGAETNLKGFYSLLVAVLGHKLLDGFALGVPLYFANLPKWQTYFALIFCACMTPLGIAVGIASTQFYEGPTGKLASAIILSLSSGSFFFISLVELIPSGMNMHGWHKSKMAAVVIGWGLMAFIALYV